MKPSATTLPKLARQTRPVRLRDWFLGATALLVMLLAWQAPLFAIDQAKPGDAPMQGAPGMADPHGGMFGASGPTADAAAIRRGLTAFYAKQIRTAFESNIDLAAFRLLAIQHSDQMKIMDSWARQSISKIRNRQTIDGKDPLYVALDIALRPEAWADQNIVYVQGIPIREQLTRFAPGNTDDERKAEAQRIMTKGLVSPNFLLQQPVLAMLENLSHDMTRAGAVNKVLVSLETFLSLGKTLTFLPPPPTARGTAWIHPLTIRAALNAEDLPAPTAATAPARPTSPYTDDQSLRISLAYQQFKTGWQTNDVTLANAGIAGFVAAATSIDPEGYPSSAKRTTELWYNRTYNGTLVAFVYFFAMTLFLLVAVGVTKRVENKALLLFGIAVGLHILAMGVRWWLAGRIPIKNQFESVMGAACIGATIGFFLERWKRNGIFGVAFSFVGFLATTTCVASPFVFGTDLGAPIGKVAGILDDAWLYIHVNIVIASYALIFASAVIAAIFLGLRQWHWVNPLEPGDDSADDAPSTSGRNFTPGNSGGTAVATAPTLSTSAIQASRDATLDTLDQANMVVLQMAMWFLGIGIICGAVWADHSWGRPWGWDPKETFALVTWIVYLIIVHMRFVTKAKADWSAWLAIAGCAVMLFNWIGVNFFLAGLHSYA